MMKNRKLFGILLAALVLSGFGGCGDKETTSTLSATYQVGGVDVTALSVEDETGVTEQSSKVYTYQGLEDAGAVAQGYVSQLTNEENGFVVVNQEYMEAQQPDYSAEENQVFLAKVMGEEEGVEEEEPSSSEASSEVEATATGATTETKEEAVQQLLTIELVWSPGQCVVTLGTDEGVIQMAEDVEPVEPMTELEMVDYFNTLSPSDLGLSGESMGEYEVYAMGGNVLVNDKPCMKLQVYDRDNAGETNHFAGLYLMSSGGESLYRVDMSTGQVEQLSVAIPL